MPGMVMLVSKVTVPTSRGLPVAGSAKVRTKVFVPTLSWPASFASVITASLVFCVWIGFGSAALTGATTPVSSTAAIATITSRRAIERSSLTVQG